jgi:hypothetical protein
MTLRVGMGASELADGRAAGEQAARAACAPFDGGRPDLVLVFVSVRYDLADVLEGINAVTGDAPLAGATSSGHLHAGVLTQPGAGVAVLALDSDDHHFGVASVTGVGANSFQAGRELARAARGAAGERLPHEAVLVLSDGLAGDQQELLSGIHRVTGVAVPVVGGAAGDDRRLTQTFVLRDGEVLTDAAVAVWIGSRRPLTVVSGHGWQPTGLPLLVTGVDGPVVREISGRPALEVYREHFRYEDPADEMRTDRDGGYHSAHAFGLIQPDGQLLIRGAFVDDDGQLRTFAPLPAYAAVQVVTCGPDDLLDVGDATLADALDGKDARVALVFSCVARLDILAHRAGEEAARLQQVAGDVPTFGFYTYGEFARTSSVVGYHNATIAALIL